jgi:hypothetical protein
MPGLQADRQTGREEDGGRTHTHTHTHTQIGYDIQYQEADTLHLQYGICMPMHASIPSKASLVAGEMRRIHDDEGPDYGNMGDILSPKSDEARSRFQRERKSRRYTNTSTQV